MKNISILILLIILITVSFNNIYSDTKESDRFMYGMYSRLVVSDTTNGKSGKPLNVVAFGTRLEESSYQELSLIYRIVVKDEENDLPDVFAVTTLATHGPYAHYSDYESAQFVIRNAYIEARDVFTTSLNLWIGSRMYRGDQIYLFDYWFLDNLNTYGFGISYGIDSGNKKYFPDRINVAFHCGTNRKKDDFQYLEITSFDDPTKKVETFERQRYITSSTLLVPFMGMMSLKFHTEYHHLPSGDKFDGEEHKLFPQENGNVYGIEYSLYNFLQDSVLNLYFRYAKDLAGLGEFGIPYIQENSNSMTKGIKDWWLAFNYNFRYDAFGLIVSGYYRRFKDPHFDTYTKNDFNEYIIAGRPMYYIYGPYRQMFEVSYQRKETAEINSITLKREPQTIFKFSFIPALNFGKADILNRPEIRFIYTIAFYNWGASHSYDPYDWRYGKDIQHFIGVGSEWWF